MHEERDSNTWLISAQASDKRGNAMQNVVLVQTKTFSSCTAFILKFAFVQLFQKCMQQSRDYSNVFTTQYFAQNLCQYIQIFSKCKEIN